MLGGFFCGLRFSVKLLLLRPIGGRQKMGQGRSFAVTVEEVHSGDDLVVMADLGIDKLYKKVRVRLHGVDTPNAYKAKLDSVAGSLRDEVKKITQDRKCRIELVSEGKGGWLGVLYVQDGTKEVNINELLKSRGYVYKSNGEAADGCTTKNKTSTASH